MRKDLEQYIPAMARVLSDRWASDIGANSDDYWRCSEAESTEDARAMLSVIPDAQPAALAVPEGWKMVPTRSLETALEAVQSLMQAAYENGHQECCGQSSGWECCGSPVSTWDAVDEGIMDALAPAQRELSAMLAAAPTPPAGEVQS